MWKFCAGRLYSSMEWAPEEGNKVNLKKLYLWLRSFQYTFKYVIRNNAAYITYISY